MKRRAWFSDQYQHPHESKHTIEEIQGWFKQTGFSFVKSLPKLGFAAVFDENEKLFRPEYLGHRFERLLGELMMMFTNSHEGGFFLAIGQNRA